VTFTPAQPVPAPQTPGVRYGLFTAAVGPLDLDDRATGGGVTWKPESCGRAHTWPAVCHPDGEKTVDAGQANQVADPFAVYGSAVCGSAGTTAAEVARLAQVNLANGEQAEVESALAAQLAASAVEVFPADAAQLAAVVAELEQWLYGTAGYGTVGYLHAPPRVAAWAMQANLLVPAGPVLTTRMGTRWVFGGGYPDDGYINISGLVTVWRSAAVLVPPAQLNRTTNQWTAVAERAYAVGFDCLAGRAFFDWLPLS
jgi:hypothetical protein